NSRVSSGSEGQRIVTASYDKSARVWDAATGKLITVLEGHNRSVDSAAFSPDGQHILTTSDDNSARVWDAATGQQMAALDHRSGPVHRAAFSPDGWRIVTSNEGWRTRLGCGGKSADRGLSERRIQP